MEWFICILWGIVVALRGGLFAFCLWLLCGVAYLRFVGCWFVCWRRVLAFRRGIL